MKTPINKPNTHTQIGEYFLATLYLVMKIHADIPVSRHTKTRLPRRPASLHSSGERGGGGGAELRREHFETVSSLDEGYRTATAMQHFKRRNVFQFSRNKPRDILNPEMSERKKKR